MANSNKVKIIFPNGETIQCDKLIASLRNNDTFDELEQLFIGDWNLEQLVETKSILNQIFSEQIRERLSPEDKMLLERIKAKEQEEKESFIEELSDKEQKLYKQVNEESEMVRVDNVPQELEELELEEIELEEFFNELLDSDLEENESRIKDNKSDNVATETKVIDFESYKQQRL
ncbi:hypothetical protein JCM16358_05990 [Halanaerocella petrolearia]